MRFLNSAVAALALLAAGCSNGIPVEQYYAEGFKALCVRYARCGVFSSEAACNAYYQRVAESSSSKEVLEDPVKAGKVKYDGEQVQRCLEALASAACNSLETPEVCKDAIVGLVPIGGDCITAECVPEAYCTRGAYSATCPGTCKPRVEEGGVATSSSQCKSPLIMVDGKCEKPRQAGETCPTASSSGCASGLTCVNGKCQAYADKGEACTATADCAMYFSCIDGTCRVPGGVGEACKAQSLFACKLDLYCNSEAALCKERQGEGESCVSSGACRDGLTCDTSTQKCVRLASLGERCTAGSCNSTGSCDASTKVCKPRSTAGQPCTNYDQCVLGTSCVEGTCRSPYSCQ